MEGNQGFVYLAVINIPKDSYRSVDLRTFFNEFIENEQLECFHFLHRGIENHKDKCVAFVKITEKFYEPFVKAYHSVQYYDKHNKLRNNFCAILTLHYSKLTDSSRRRFVIGIPVNDGEEIKTVSENDFFKFREFRPPPLYPNGNVGTPNKYFNNLIGAAKLPTSIIKRLELTTPRLIKKYARVRYDYPAKQGSKWKKGDIDETEEKKIESVDEQKTKSKKTQSTVVMNIESPNSILPGEKLSENRHIRLLPVWFRQISLSSKTDDLKNPINHVKEKLNEREISYEKTNESQSESEPEEEWDRREAHADDPMKLEHNKEIVYESPMEVVWEKGGPGLVWKTDESERRNYDFDEITTDDWDMDMAVYNKGTEACASKDAVDLAEIRRGEKNRKDGPESAFRTDQQNFPQRIMSKQGWSVGQGLGRRNQGISEALSADGQMNRRGLGYYGEKVIWKDNLSKPNDRPKKRDRNPGNKLIASAYDNLSKLDNNPEGDERASHLQMKFRDDVRFPKHPRLKND